MLLGAIFGLLLSAISLDGVTGDGLSADAFFDANNVRLGDPMLLTVDFFGKADLDDLHPPKLAAAVNSHVWKIDDASAKTVTGRGIRRLTYRVRPIREGLQTFPALEFAYLRNGTNANGRCTTQPLPVHVKPGQQAALSGGETESFATRCLPDGIVIATAEPLDEDTAFAWRRACAHPTAEAFAKFDFPEARLNEAAALTLAGNWAKAMSIYNRLEWRTGQTPEIERGIVAALDAQSDGQVQTLPAWRVLLRPVLRYAAVGRVLVLLAILAAFVAVIFACRRLIRALVCVAAGLLVVTSAEAQMRVQYSHTVYENGKAKTVTTTVNEKGEQKTEVSEGEPEAPAFPDFPDFPTPFSLRQPSARVPPFDGTLTLEASRRQVCVAEPFDLILSFEHTKGYTLEGLQFGLSETTGLQSDTSVERLPPGKTRNPTNVVDRFSVRVHYVSPLKVDLAATIGGMARRGGGFFGSVRPFTVRSAAVPLTVSPLPKKNRPADFTGAVGSNFRVRQSVDRTLVETNDVVVVTRTVTYDGILPRDPRWTCVDEEKGRCSWRDYYIADGRTNIPPFRVTYYDVTTKGYRVAEAPSVPLAYGSARQENAAAVVVDAAGADDAAAAARSRRLRFYPSDAAPVIGETSGIPRVTEERPLWVRVDDGHRAGWIRKEALR